MVQGHASTLKGVNVDRVTMTPTYYNAPCILPGDKPMVMALLEDICFST